MTTDPQTEADVDTVANRAAQVIASMGADIRALTGERDRYRGAWRSARERAQAYGEGILRVVKDRESYQEWLRQAEERAAAAPAAPVAAPPTGQAGLRDRIAEVLRAHASLGGTPLRYELPFFDGATPSLPLISGWKPLDDVADAVLSVLPADSEPHRLALSTVLGLGTSAPWDAIREWAAELAGRPAPVDRGAMFAGVRPQTLTAIASHLDARAIAILRPDSETYTGWQTVIAELRRLAAETPSGCPGHEASPNRCACPCEGCRHNCAAHQAAETPGPETQGAQFPCQCGHGEAYHDFKYGGPRCRLCPESGEWTWRHAFRSAVMSQPEQVEAPSEPVHARPGPDDNGISPCCARPPFEFRGERLTRDPAKVTCPAPTVTLPGKEA